MNVAVPISISAIIQITVTLFLCFNIFFIILPLRSDLLFQTILLYGFSICVACGSAARLKKFFCSENRRFSSEKMLLCLILSLPTFDEKVLSFSLHALILFVSEKKHKQKRLFAVY